MSAARRAYFRPRRLWRPLDKIPLGALMNKGLTIRAGQTHVNRWTDDLLRRIEDGRSIPSFVITHTVAWRRVRRCTRRSATSRTAASKLLSSLEVFGYELSSSPGALHWRAFGTRETR